VHLLMEPRLTFKFAPMASEGNLPRMTLKADQTRRTAAGQRPFATAKRPRQRPGAAADE
jgi:hypothetical protein